MTAPHSVLAHLVWSICCLLRNCAIAPYEPDSCSFRGIYRAGNLLVPLSITHKPCASTRLFWKVSNKTLSATGNMSSSTELPMLEPYWYEHEVLNQPLLQPDTSYWPTSESPIARALSSSTIAPGRIPSLHNGLGISTTLVEPRRSLGGSFHTPMVEAAPQDLHIHHPMSHLHLSEVETSYADVPSGLPWVQPRDDQMMLNGLYQVNSFDSAPTYSNSDYWQSSYLNDPSYPYSTPSLYNDSPVQSPYLSAPELYSARRHGRVPRSSPPEDYDIDDEDEEDVSDGKPYARLIYEALLQAPGHRMMLRDVYDWFERNTNKPQESGSNGWQNSIRHNLSMNKVC